MNTKILVIGAKGQLGSELTSALQHRYGLEHVIASDIQRDMSFTGIFEVLDATNKKNLEDIIQRYGITQIYHLAAILSAKGEENPLQTWELNMKTWLLVLEAARLHKVQKVFYPSSIAIYGNNDLMDEASNSTLPNPLTVYGISKVAGEHWANYYYQKYNLDVRSLRFPGIIGYKSLPGGGTTDYAVEIFHKAVQEKEFTCFLKKDTRLPMIFMNDAIRATMELMDAPAEQLNIRTSYAISGISFSPEEIFQKIKNRYPDFKIRYEPDYRQKIAESWPNLIDDKEARNDWGWKPTFDIDQIVESMVEKLKEKYKLTSI